MSRARGAHPPSPASLGVAQPIRVAALVLLTLSVFATDPYGFDRWVFPKEFLLVLAAIVASLVVPASRLPRFMWWWFAAAFAVLVATSIVASAPFAQFMGRWPRYEGLVSLAAYALAVVLGATLLGGNPRDRDVRSMGDVYLAALAAGLSVTAVVAGLEAAGLRPIPTDLDRPGALLGNASDLGVVGVIGICLFVPRLRNGIVKAPAAVGVVNILGMVSAVAIVVLSGSRGALLGAAIGLLCLIVVGVARHDRRPWWLLLAGVAGAILAGSALLPATRDRVSGADVMAAESASNRWELWGDAVQLIGQHPVLGVGASGFADAVTAVVGPSWHTATGIGGWIESPHMFPLQVAVAGGAAGVAVIVALVVFVVLRIRREGPGGPFGVSAVVALVAGTATLMTHFTSPGTMLLLSVLLGSTIAAQATDSHRSAQVLGSFARVATWVALLAWSAFLVLAMAADHAFRSGIEAARAGDPLRAEDSFVLAAAMRPWDSDLPLMVAETMAAETEAYGSGALYATASDWAATAVSRLPASSRALKAQATIAQFDGDFAAGIASLERAAELSPTDPQVFHRLGGLYYLAGKAHRSLAALERAAELAPTDADIRETLDFVRRQSP